MKKKCKKCNEEKNICDFSKNINSKDNLNRICKECDKIKSREYRLKNPEKVSISNKKTRIKHLDKYKSKSKQYYEKNKDNILIKVKEYYKNNKDKYKITKSIYHKNNKEKLNKRAKEYGKKNRTLLSEKDKLRRKSDPLFRTIRYIRNRINKYIKQKNYKKNSKSFEIVGCSPENLKKYLENKFTDGMCWDLMGSHIHIDHIVPLSSANTEEELYKLCHYTNLQPLWAKDNLSKSNK
jgi:hypothetical protein